LSRAGGRVARIFSTVTLGRLLYAVQVAVVVTLGLLVVFGRSRYFPVLAILFLFGFILAGAIAALTVFRRKGFALRTTLLLFVAAPFVAVLAVTAHARWVDSRWPANRDCLQDLARSIVKEFEGLGESTIVRLTPHGESHLAHPRSNEFAPRILACGLRDVAISSEQIEFRVDDLLVASGGYVFRHRGSAQLTECPYIMTGVKEPIAGRRLEERWYYCRG